MDVSEIVRRYYDQDVESEWARLERHPVEFELTKRFMLRYIRPGDRVLDIGGGPGRYSLFLSEMGCQATLADLSQGNVDFALAKAGELGLSIQAVQANALDLSRFADESFDHVLLMGPLYHLIEEQNRELAVREALRVLKPGGVLFVAFISSYAGVVYYMKYQPEAILMPEAKADWDQFVEDRDFCGMAFTHAYFIRQSDVLPFMARFPQQKLHFLGSEGITAPCEPILMAQPKEVMDAWTDLSEKVCEREDLMSYSEHFLYVGRKTV